MYFRCYFVKDATHLRHALHSGVAFSQSLRSARSVAAPRGAWRGRAGRWSARACVSRIGGIQQHTAPLPPPHSPPLLASLSSSCPVFIVNDEIQHISSLVRHKKTRRWFFIVFISSLQVYLFLSSGTSAPSTRWSLTRTTRTLHSKTILSTGFKKRWQLINKLPYIYICIISLYI